MFNPLEPPEPVDAITSVSTAVQIAMENVKNEVSYETSHTIPSLVVIL